MSDSTTCFICTESYRRNVNPPITLSPCGHICCSPCITTWRRDHDFCPKCRTKIVHTMPNRDLMDIIEEQNAKSLPSDCTDNTDTSSSTNNTSSSSPYSKDIKKEVIRDRCATSIYVIDNSGSMGNYADGKIFEMKSNGTIHSRKGVLRWKEAVSKTQQIARYNVERKMRAAYYLLNPRNRKQSSRSVIGSLASFWNGAAFEWEENTDFVVIDAKRDGVEMTMHKMDFVLPELLSEDNIRGNTPLDAITHHFGSNMSSFVEVERIGDRAIGFNLITDGEPNDKHKFERELRSLADRYPIFLTINLCTDNEQIVDYYNELDTAIGRELSGCDVIDDLESEQKEVLAAGNRFFVYSMDIHIARMAGCFSIIADQMDERTLTVYHAAKLCDEICGIDRKRNDEIPTFDDRENYIRCLAAKTKMVYDFRRKQMAPSVDIDKLDRFIQSGGRCESALEVLIRQIREYIVLHPITAMMVAIAIIWWFR